jgi:hypothetical protein
MPCPLSLPLRVPDHLQGFHSELQLMLIARTFDMNRQPSGRYAGVISARPFLPPLPSLEI